MKKFLTLLVMVLMSVSSFGYDALINGVYYNLVTKAKEAEVTYGDWQPAVQKGPYGGSISIPDSVEYDGVIYNVVSIGKLAFCNSDITEIKLPNNLRKIEDSAFSGCGYLNSLSIPDGVESIGMTAFQSTGLKSLVLPNSVKSIGYMAFINCKELVSVQLSNKLEIIDVAAFMQCDKLESIALPESLLSMGNSVFYSCTSLTTVELPSTLNIIPESSFKGCSKLKSLDIPEGACVISKTAFYGCSSLSEIYLPSSLTDIYSEAFADCRNIESVYCMSEQVPYARDDAFKDSYIEYTTLFVPENAIDYYVLYEPWKSFKSIEPISGTEIDDNKCELPTISYVNGELKFSCLTEDVSFICEITDNDIKKYNDTAIKLTATYYISVFATKDGYKNSDVVYATLCWIDAEPKTVGITDGVATVRAYPVLIQSNGNVLNISGTDVDTPINVYDLSGKLVGSASSTSGSTSVTTSLSKGQVGIIKIGDKSVKVIMK